MPTPITSIAEEVPVEVEADAEGVMVAVVEGDAAHDATTPEIELFSREASMA